MCEYIAKKKGGITVENVMVGDLIEVEAFERDINGCDCDDCSGDRPGCEYY